MKRILAILACVTTLAFIGGTTLKSAENGRTETSATVTAVHGDVQYQVNGGPWMKLRPNATLAPGSAVRTGPEAYADVAVNGHSSAVRIEENTTMEISTMFKMGSGRDADTQTMLNVKDGSIVGNVKKISANSSYEITTPKGVAGIRGTDFSVSVRLTPQGVRVTFRSVNGQVLCAAVINSATITKILNGGQEWTPGVGDVDNIPAAELQQFSSIVQAIAAELQALNLVPGTHGGHAIFTSPFSTGGQPQNNDNGQENGSAH